VKARAAAKAAVAVAAAATSNRDTTELMNLRRLKVLCLVMILAISSTAMSGVLPEDRTDILYHLYDGGGVTIDGPSVLVRKQVGKSLSFAANYYVDMVSSASIDVITTASP
jgi:hypothetical protein